MYHGSLRTPFNKTTTTYYMLDIFYTFKRHCGWLKNVGQLLFKKICFEKSKIIKGWLVDYSLKSQSYKRVLRQGGCQLDGTNAKPDFSGPQNGRVGQADIQTRPILSPSVRLEMIFGLGSITFYFNPKPYLAQTTCSQLNIKYRPLD